MISDKSKIGHKKSIISNKSSSKILSEVNSHKEKTIKAKEVIDKQPTIKIINDDFSKVVYDVSSNSKSKNKNRSTSIDFEIDKNENTSANVTRKPNKSK